MEFFDFAVNNLKTPENILEITKTCNLLAQNLNK
jgi:hypothetical protein